MQDLYTAVMYLGRSMREVKRTGWACTTIGRNIDGPKCINGVVSFAAAPELEEPAYICDLLEGRPELRGPLRIAMTALVRAAPTDIIDAIEQAGNGAVHVFRGKNIDSVFHLSDALIAVNDAYVSDGETIGMRLMTKERVLQWISDAMDILAVDLPEPIPASPPLTVDQIVGAPPLPLTREAMLGIPDDEIRV